MDRGDRRAFEAAFDPVIATSHVESALGCWATTSDAPTRDDALARVVDRIWLFNGSTVLPGERVFPDGTLEIVLQLDAAYKPAGATDPFPALSVGGLRTTAFAIEGPRRPVRVLGLRLRPSGAFALLRTSLHDLTDLDLDLHAVVGRAAAELGERCASARDDVACVAASLAWIRSRTERPPESMTLVDRAVAAIEAGAGDVTIAAIDELGRASSGRFAACFRERVGVAPKRFARIVRFRRALALLDATDASIGAVAATAGYYDQPHMNAEFRAHAGMTPHAFRRAERYPNTTSLAEQIFQDGAASIA